MSGIVIPSVKGISIDQFFQRALASEKGHQYHGQKTANTSTKHLADNNIRKSK